MWVRCNYCGSEGDVSLPEPGKRHGLLACPSCGRPITEINVAVFAPWIQEQVARKNHLHVIGKLGSRKQAIGQSDMDIDRDGMAAELAACLLICPGYFEVWKASQGPNRGRDLPREWTGLSKPCEVKQTRYKDFSRGYLLVRPPRWTPGAMRPEYIDDSIYVLLCGQPYHYEAVGWIDRDGLLACGLLNPVPVRQGQRQCWGVHWSRLYAMESLFRMPVKETRRSS